MKLTNTIRDAYVRSAMNDVPEIDYDEQLRKAVTAAAVKALPPAVRKVYDDEKLRPYLERTFMRFGGVSVSVPGRDARWDEPDTQLPKLAPADVAALEKLEQQQLAQKNAREDLAKRLRSAAYSVTTHKALAELLPEFAKYLPVDESAAIRTLPVVANIVADFTKAGWPKAKKVQAKKAAKA